MNRNRTFLMCLLLLLPLFCQAQSLFSKYSDMSDVSSVYITKTMIEMNPDLYTKDVTIGKIAKNLELVQILSTMNDRIKKEMRRDIESVVNNQKYELLMKQKGIVSRMAFYVQRKGENVSDLIMVTDGPATLKYIRLVGDMTLKDIQSIVKSQKTSENLNPIDQIKRAISDINIDYSNEYMEDFKELNDLKKELDALKKELKNSDWSYVTEINK